MQHGKRYVYPSDCVTQSIRRKYPHNMIKIGFEWFIRQTGMGASAHLESGGFIRRFVIFKSKT
jgi:hypothetical protein